MKAIEKAASYVGQRETGRNRSKLIDMLNKFVGNPLGSPYCAAGVSYCMHHQNTPGQGFPKTGSSQEFKRWAIKKKRFFTDPNELKTCKGALVGFTNEGDEGHGHIAFVEGRLTDPSGKVVGIRTIEFNSDLGGDREGEGVYRLERHMIAPGKWQVENAQGELVGKVRQLWFVRLDGVLGGEWWT